MRRRPGPSPSSRGPPMMSANMHEGPSGLYMPAGEWYDSSEEEEMEMEMERRRGRGRGHGREAYWEFMFEDGRFR